MLFYSCRQKLPVDKATQLLQANMYQWILVIAFFPNTYGAFPFYLKEREHDVFKNVPMWALDSKGVEYLGTFGNHLICEDTTLMATFTHIRKCFKNCSDESSYYKKYFTGIYGTGSKQFELNPRRPQCRSKNRSRRSMYLLDLNEVVRRVIRKREMNRGNRTRKQPNSKSRQFKSLLQRAVLQALTRRPTNSSGYEKLLAKTLRLVITKKGMKNSDNYPKSRTKRAVRTKKWSQLIVKLLIVVDYALYMLLEKDFEFIAQYMNIFWSAVDLKYRPVQPKINFQITGVIIAKEPNVLGYVEDSQFSYDDKDTLDVYESLHNFQEIQKYLNNTDIPKFHSIVTISGLQGWCDEEFVYGLAFQKGICTNHKNGAIVIDDGQYFGVHNAVHELGHLLGLDHDGVDEIIEDEFGYYNCTDPSDKSGKHYIMFERYELSHYDVLWSNCSLQYFNILESDDAVSCAGVPHKP